MEQSFDLAKVIEHFKLDREEVETVLFPHVRYRKQALDRVLKGEGQLTVEQLQALANLSGEFKVKLNYNGVFLSIYKGTTLVHQEINSSNKTLQEFLSYITLLTNKL